MAIAIRTIPILSEKEANAFNEKANATYSRKASVDFSKEVKSTRSILSKAKLR